MLKYLAMLAVLLAAMPPMPRQTTARSGNGSGKTNGDSQSNNHPTAPLATIINPAQSPKDSKHAGEITTNEGEHSVTLTSVPPLTIKDRQKTFLDYVYDWGPWVFGLFLAIFGGLQLRLLRVTWKAIQEQKGEMANQTSVLKDSVAAAKDSAKAANDQIQSMKDKERARIVFTPQSLTEIRKDDLFCNDLAVIIENVGATHAFNVRIDYQCRITTTDAEPSETAQITDSIGIVRSGQKLPDISLYIGGEPEIWEQILVPRSFDDDLYTHFWGTIHYSDVFGDAHQIRFQYVFGIRSLTQKIVKDGPYEDTLLISSISQLLGWSQCTHPSHNYET